MSAVHHESQFQKAIIESLCNNGWERGSNAEYRADLGLDTVQLFTFIGATQQSEWDTLVTFYGGDQESAQRGFVKQLDKAIANNGLLDVLRKGVKDHGVKIRVAYFKPSLVESESALDLYRANRLTVVKELAYATKQSGAGNRLDLVLFLNGIPVATAELKNPLTGQGVEDAKEQYRHDRDPTELIFTRRVIANFAVDPTMVFVATQLRGPSTPFLPFNMGSNGPGQAGGAGNPPATLAGKYATSYLWEEVWQRDNWLDLLERFVHISEQKGVDGRTRKTVIFPRYQQWHAVKQLAAHAARHGAGHNYLVMASAGSGKSNTIAWLAHRLASLHTPTRIAELDPGAVAAGLKPGIPVFDKVLIITDRRNLDTQLRDTVGSFEQTAGLVVKIDEKQGAKSEQLARALSRETGKIVTVTLQTFPALVEYLKQGTEQIQGNRFAIVVDEAHSSQSGDAAGAVRKVLRDLGLDSDSEDAGATSAAASDDTEAKLTAHARKRQRAANLSYFAFTATPKAKTLEQFGTLGPDGTYRPFHTYSMRQAIDEGFILDPLRNYVTYATYWKLVNQNPDERDVDSAKASKELARFAVTHPSTVAQHAEVIVEHFRTHTMRRLGGRAKAMVVTASRQSAVQMSRAIKRHLADKGYPNPGVLVAFSGSLTYEGEETTEPKENGGLAESALPKAFAYTRADDKSGATAGKPEYRILVVAEKYQTGFDQPLLTTMYVVKKLHGIAAVQTLSRLNRTTESKSQADLAVLDFVNDGEKIKEAFRPYYEDAETLPSDPNLLYTAQSKVLAAKLLYDDEMRQFVAAYLAADDKSVGGTAKQKQLHAELYRHLEPAVERFTALVDSEDEEERETAEAFRAHLNDYVRKYGFLSQIVPYTDADLEMLYLYGRHLLNRLPRRADGGVDIGEVDLSHLRVERTGEHDLGLNPEGNAEIPGYGDGSGGAKEPEKSPLSELVEKFNDKFGTEFTEQDVLKPLEEAMAEKRVQLAAVANDEENFGHVFDSVFEGKMIDHFDTVRELGERYFNANEPDFRSSLNRSARRAAWRLIRQQQGVVDDAA